MLGVIFAVIITISIYGGANFYVARMLYLWLKGLFPNINTKLYICTYTFIALSLFLGFMSLPLVLKTIASRIGAYWMGIFMYLLIFILLANFLALFFKTTKLIPIAVLLTVGLVCYGMYNASQIRVVSYEIGLRDASLDGLKIALISDLHLGAAANNFEKKLENVVQIINGLNPDIVAIVGDIFNDDFHAIRDPDRAAALFRSIDAKYGVFACLGNHDGGRTIEQMKNFLKESNIRLLNDEYVIIDERFAILGRLDSRPIGGFGGLVRQDVSGIISAVGANMPLIVLEHNPIHIEEYGSEVDLILAGHTHRGQIFPGSLITKAMFVVDYGHYQKDENSPHVIVTSGVSTWGPPMRVGTSNEVVGIVLR
jgi:predicted MPP superfamily phosphohydrolase